MPPSPVSAAAAEELIPVVTDDPFPVEEPSMSSFPSSISPVANGDGGTAFWPSAPLLGVRLTRACNKQNEHKQKTNKVKGKNICRI